MGQSYRIRTELGINKTINLSLDQDFEFLEILSLKIQQTDVYTRNCADYGVVVGRVIANNGFGIPNARVSVFIPITSVDQSNPIITSIYPYKSPDDKNEDGFRYNLLPYEKSFSAHAATGTFPTRNDALTNPTVVEIYDKYYKLTAKTNDSGDYMIMGVPLGAQTLVMDVDLSDIGEFSLTPQDLIRMGLATETQVAGNRFRTSNDLNSLPQIINIQKDIEVLPLWGDPTTCQIAITRADFDLRDEANVDIQPTAVFMGSIFSGPEKMRVRPGFKVLGSTIGGCKPKDNLGNLCDLVSGPGQILAVRQTVDQDIDGNPVLEQYQLEQSGNIIDGDGTWLTELPMNLDYVITNEFGERVISSDPSVGIPTKSKYRFKVKWQQPPTLTEQTRRAYFLVPNVKEYGWSSSNVDPNFLSPTFPSAKQLSSSYYFGLAWSGYTDGFSGQDKTNKLNDAINCEDTFYEFQFNRVYTVSSLIDQWKKGSRGRFIGIKEIDDDDCSGSVNKFPTNDGVRNFDFLFFLFSILLTILQPTIIILLGVANIALGIINIIINILCGLSRVCFLGICPFGWIRNIIPCRKNLFVFRLPMITYPNCQTCECKQELKSDAADVPETVTNNVSAGGALTYVSLSETYFTKFQNLFSASTSVFEISLMYSETLGGQSLKANIANPSVYKLPLSQNLKVDNIDTHLSSKGLPLGERINIFNSRKNYFDNINKIKIKVEPTLNVGSDKFHYDNTLTLLSNTQFAAGDLLSVVNIEKSTDLNWLWSASTQQGIVTGISGTPYTTTAATNVNITYATSPSTSQTVSYSLPYGTNDDNYRFPADIEYFQVVTAITWNDIVNLWNPSTLESFPNILSATTVVNTWKKLNFLSYQNVENRSITPIDFVENLESQYVLILQRGVDPYSPKYKQQYQLGNLFGVGESDPKFTFTAETRLNIPIQVNTSPSISVQAYNQNEMFYKSYFFQPGSLFSGYTTLNTGYYGLLDSNQSKPFFLQNSGNQVVSKTANGFYLSSPNGAKYDLSEDLSGLDAMGCNNYFDSLGTTHPDLYLSFFNYNSYSRTIYGGVSWSSMTINTITKDKNVLRTDRLPSSDRLDGGSWSINPSLLQQNLNFNFYIISTADDDISSSSVALGADQEEIDIAGLPDSVKVLESFDCENMVDLDCYTGFGSSFQIDQNCVKKDAVERGCYLFLRNPPFGIFKDIGNFSEWAYRFRFFYGLCRGVLSQTFVNNWINGTLFAFPIQVDTTYDRQNKPTSKYCQDLIHFDQKTTNFYYRSSPWNGTKFIGKTPADSSVNKRNLLFPTTIINLGMKDSYFRETSFEPSTRAYIMTELDSTTFGDTSDLINLFVISRITDASFLGQLLNSGDNSLNQLFSRPQRRIDGDLAQLMSINSELGNVNFSPEYYEVDPNSTNNPTRILGTPKSPVIAVWFSSTTENLQTKDYITPGRIDFRATPTSNFSPFNYGIKSQLVPFYPWGLESGGGNTIFGTQYNNWRTNESEIFQKKYQSLDRVQAPNPTYFISNNPQPTDLSKRGYIFSIDSNGNYSTTAQLNSNFIVGAPFQFYFGVAKGKSALDKFKTKYSIVE